MADAQSLVIDRAGQETCSVSCGCVCLYEHLGPSTCIGVLGTVMATLAFFGASGRFLCGVELNSTRDKGSDF